MMTEKKYERYYDLAGKASFENWESVRKSTLCPECFIDAVIGDASGIPIQEDVLEELNEWMFGDPDSHVLKTERLLIRPVREQDAADIFEIRGDPETADWAGVPCMKSIEDVSSQIDPDRALSVVLGGDVIGLMQFFFDKELNGDFLGYYMKKSHRGKGYMTEALTALRNKLVEEGEEIPMLWIYPGNDASERVATKSGWKYLASPVVDINGLNQVVNLYG